MVSVVILGGNGVLGRSVAELLKKNAKITLTFVVRDEAVSAKGLVFWDYRSCIPEQLKRADVIVNCARSKDFAFNVAFNKILIRSVLPSTKFINISSNAVFAKPNGALQGLIFRGDAYVREKKCIESFSSYRKNIVTIRPAVVTDEGAWKSFFMSCKAASRVIAPAGGEMSRIKVARRAYIAKAVETCIFRDENVPLEVFESIDLVNSWIGSQIIFGAKKSNFFDSTLKNILLSIASSWFIPDRIVFMLQKAVVSGKRSRDKNGKLRQVVIEGMTRLYLFGSHTK